VIAEFTPTIYVYGW